MSILNAQNLENGPDFGNKENLFWDYIEYGYDELSPKVLNKRKRP